MAYIFTKPRKLKKKDAPALQFAAGFFTILAIASYFLFPKAADADSFGTNVKMFWLMLVFAVVSLAISFVAGRK